MNRHEVGLGADLERPEDERHGEGAGDHAGLLGTEVDHVLQGARTVELEEVAHHVAPGGEARDEDAEAGDDARVAPRRRDREPLRRAPEERDDVVRLEGGGLDVRMHEHLAGGLPERLGDAELRDGEVEGLARLEAGHALLHPFGGLAPQVRLDEHQRPRVHEEQAAPLVLAPLHRAGAALADHPAELHYQLLTVHESSSLSASRARSNSWFFSKALLSNWRAASTSPRAPRRRPR